MEATGLNSNVTWDNLHSDMRKRVLSFLDPVQTLIFAETSRSGRAAVKEVNKGKVSRMKTKYMAELVKGCQLEIIVWARAQKPPCPCDVIECLALAKESREVVKVLLEKGANMYAETSNRDMILHWTCENGHAEVAVALMDKGANMNAKETDETMPLHDACFYGHEEVVLALRVKSANVNTKETDGCTPLLHARGEGHPEIAGILRLVIVLLENAAGER